MVHLAAIPAPGSLPDAATFENNMLSTYNVFQAARRAGIKKIVYASSETVLGLPFDVDPPYIPVDEEYPARPESTYSLVKHLEEQMAIQLTRWDPELSIVGLRFSNVMDPEDYDEFPVLRRGCQRCASGTSGATSTAGTAPRPWHVPWSTASPGSRRFIIANEDTVMSRSSASLAAEVFPGRQSGQGTGRARDPALHRQGQAAPRLRARAQLADLPLQPHHTHRGLSTTEDFGWLVLWCGARTCRVGLYLEGWGTSQVSLGLAPM